MEAQEYKKQVEALRECANWIEAVAASSQYAHDELMALAYADKLRDADDTIEALMKINNRFRELLDNRNKDVAELQRKVDELTTKNEALRGRIEDKELQIDMLTADNTNYDIAIDELKAQLPKRGEDGGAG